MASVIVYPQPAYCPGSEQLDPEAGIHWRYSMDSFDYVRQRVATFSTKQRGLGKAAAWSLPEGAWVIGWSTAAPTFKPSSPGMFRRRVFYLKPYDRHSYTKPEPDGFWYVSSHPVEAVDPATVAPNDLGLLTARCHGKEMSQEQWDALRSQRVRGRRFPYPEPTLIR